MPDTTDNQRNRWILLIAASFLVLAIGMSVWLLQMLMGTNTQKISTGPITPPNLLLITLDTTRKDHLNSYGYDRDTSPAMDAVAKDGVVFEQVFTVATNSAPSHATMFTGLYPFEHGLVDNGRKLNHKFLTLAEFLQAHNYDTAAYIGYYAIGRESGLDQGFATFERHDVPSHKHAKKDLAVETRGLLAALDWIKKWNEQPIEKKKPFMLWLHVQNIHDSFDPPSPYDGLFMDVPHDHVIPGHDDFNIRCSNKIKKVWYNGRMNPELQTQMIALYDGEIRMVDDYLKRIFEFLGHAGVYDDTNIILLADHGELFFEQAQGTIEPNHPGHTGRHVDQSLGIPLIIKPTTSLGVDSGLRLPQLVSTVDVMPTLLEMLGYDQLPWFTGHSLLPLMRNPRLPGRDAIFFQELPYGDTYTGIRTRSFKLINKNHEQEIRHWLFDLQNDPMEQDNIFQEQPEMAQKLQKRVQELLSTQQEMELTDYQDMSQKMLEELRKAGYIRDERSH